MPIRHANKIPLIMVERGIEEEEKEKEDEEKEDKEEEKEEEQMEGKKEIVERKIKYSTFFLFSF